MIVILLDSARLKDFYNITSERETFYVKHVSEELVFLKNPDNYILAKALAWMKF